MPNLTSIISSHISDLYGDIGFFPTLSAPPKSEHGEYCFGVFTLAKPVGKAPNIIAEEIATELHKDVTHFTQVNVIGGYVNFSCTSGVWINIFSDVQKMKIEKKGETIIVDYIGANIGKPLHIGHLCTPSVGQSIINTYSYLGYHVIGDTHIGDWGLFGKLIAAHKLLGRENGLKEKGVEYLLELYIAITAQCEADKSIEEYCRNEFRKLSDGDEENMKLWGEFTSVSLKSMNATLETIHVKPDYDIGESFYENLPLPKLGDQPTLIYTMNDIVKELLEKNIAIKNEDGSVAVIFPEEKKLPSVVIQKKDGTNLYLTADICAIKYRLTNGWNPSKIVYCVDMRQQMHFKQCFEVCRMAGWLENIELHHAGNGHISLPDGAMSTRKGNIIRLEDLVEEGFVRTKEILEEKGRSGETSLSENNIREIAVGAIKYSYLMQDRERNVTFDWNKALSFEGNSGPYIQYACVRAKKVYEQGKTYIENLAGEQSFELSEYDTVLIRTLAEMEGKIKASADTYKPHHLALYCYDLAVCFNSFYVHTPKILEESDEKIKNLRLNLCKLTSEKLTLGFELLGIKMPTEM
ncbi:arginine--tRNA ligase [Candidatus Gracilibacteria bacterium]|nr:arginine--tRNA ligase [Candidatus Gracilibacteria bacterium]